jgi:hypothetical protein
MNRPLSQFDLTHYVAELKIPYFRGVYMRDTLPRYCNEIECGILNLDSINGPGTHWTCWYKTDKQICYYFDSFGVTPPKEFEHYIKCDILYSTYQIQKYEDIICGHLCLNMLYELVVQKGQFHSLCLNLWCEKSKR